MARVRLRGNTSGTAQAIPAPTTAPAREPIYSAGGFTASPVHVAGNELLVHNGATYVPLVSSMRQVELIGAQRITGRKTYPLTALGIEGGTDGQVLTSGGGDVLRWDAAGMSYTWGIGLSEALGTVRLNVAGPTANDLGGVFVQGQATSGLVLQITGQLALAVAAAAQFGGVSVPANGGLALTGPALRVDPATIDDATDMTDAIRPITSAVLRLGGDPASDMLTQADNLVGAINEIIGLIGGISGGLHVVGTFNASTSEVTPVAGGPISGPIPAPDAAYAGFILIVNVAGTPGSPNVPPSTPMSVGDLLMCLEDMASAGDYNWNHIDLHGGTIAATNVTITAITGQPGVTHVQGSLQHLQTNKLTGPLLLHTDGSLVGNGQTVPLQVDVVDGGTF